MRKQWRAAGIKASAPHERGKSISPWPLTDPTITSGNFYLDQYMMLHGEHIDLPHNGQWVSNMATYIVTLSLQNGRQMTLLCCNLIFCKVPCTLLLHKCSLGAFYGSLARYVKLRVVHGPGMPGAFSSPPRVSNPDMHHGTCVTHVPFSMPGSLASGFLWSRWWRKRSRHSRCMRNPHFNASGKRPNGIWIHMTRYKQGMLSEKETEYFRNNDKKNPS